MKKQSIFSLIVFLIILSLLAICLVVAMALFAGTFETTLFDFSNLNFANVIPVLVFGGFICCVIIGIAVLFVVRSVFLKTKDYFNDKK